jgi:teichuronic acid biosynthesis glycosyltransferase TuaG
MISESISSVLNQTHKYFELIIIDDGSTDETSSVVNSFNDKRIIYTKINHSGLPAVARNYGASISRALLLAFIDDDDLWIENKLEKCLQIKLELSEQIALICSNEYFLDESGNKSNILLQTNHESHYIRPEDLILGNIVSSSTVVLEKKVFNDVGGFSESSDYKAVEDYHLWLRINSSHLIYYFSEPLGYYRDHVNSIRHADHSGPQTEYNVLMNILYNHTDTFVNKKYILIIHSLKLYIRQFRSCISQKKLCLTIVISNLYKMINVIIKLILTRKNN